ncbi:unnamed protein product [Scytosiphon promiscuus]
MFPHPQELSSRKRSETSPVVFDLLQGIVAACRGGVSCLSTIACSEERPTSSKRTLPHIIIRDSLFFVPQSFHGLLPEYFICRSSLNVDRVGDTTVDGAKDGKKVASLCCTWGLHSAISSAAQSSTLPSGQAACSGGSNGWFAPRLDPFRRAESATFSSIARPFGSFEERSRAVVEVLHLRAENLALVTRGRAVGAAWPSHDLNVPPPCTIHASWCLPPCVRGVCCWNHAETPCAVRHCRYYRCTCCVCRFAREGRLPV